MGATTPGAPTATAALDVLDRVRSHVTRALAAGAVQRRGGSPLGAAP